MFFKRGENIGKCCLRATSLYDSCNRHTTRILNTPGRKLSPISAVKRTIGVYPHGDRGRSPSKILECEIKPNRGINPLEGNRPRLPPVTARLTSTHAAIENDRQFFGMCIKTIPSNQPLEGNCPRFPWSKVALTLVPSAIVDDRPPTSLILSRFNYPDIQARSCNTP